MLPIEQVILIVVMLVVIIGATLIGVRRVLARQAQALQARFPSAKLIDPGANFFGQESKGVTQLRGNGTLVLTDSELYFELLVPRREYRIPLASIQSVETPMGFLGKTVGRRLLKVTYRSEGGQNDAIAWYVTNLNNIKQLLESR
jgi:hypothetical protein